MTIKFTELLDASESLIGQIEDTKDALESELGHLTHAATEIDGAISELSSEANHLHRQIAGIRDMSPHNHDPVALATVEAIDNLLALLLEAKNYLEAGQSLAALGTLQLFDNHADDLKAAIRLTVMAQRRQK